MDVRFRPTPSFDVLEMQRAIPFTGVASAGPSTSILSSADRCGAVFNPC